MENTIDAWAEAIAALPDTDFFAIMRLYLGKIQTPYNKQRLVSQLASFLKSPKITQAILALLTDRDLEFMSAINLLGGITKDDLLQFFGDSYTASEFYAIISNLRERLLIYSVNSDGKDYIFINPIILQSLAARLTIRRLLPPAEPLNQSTCDPFSLSPSFLAVFFSCIRSNPISLKNDGTLKKNSMAKLAQLFPQKEKCIEFLISGFLELSVFHEANTISIDDEKLEKFAGLPQKQQYALLSAAASAHLSRESLRKYSQLLLDCTESIPQEGFTQKSILRLAFILGAKSQGAASPFGAKGRFARLLDEARHKNDDAARNKSVLEKMLGAAEEFGLIQKSGITRDGQEFYKKGRLLEDAPSGAKPLSVESAYSVSLMPGLPLKDLLPLTHFLEARSFGIVCQFELTKNSAVNAFDSGFSVERILQTLAGLCNYELPQNMRINLQEWHNAYSAAALYQGYVLKVAPQNASFAENNPKIQKHVQEKLVDGIYLLNLPADANVKAFFEECGLPERKVKTATARHQTLDFPLLRDGKKLFAKELAEDGAESAEEEIAPATASPGEDIAKSAVESAASPAEPAAKSAAPTAHSAEPPAAPLANKNPDSLLLLLEEELSKMELDKNQRENLSARIKKRLILTPEQLSPAFVRTEILEAEGMDFSGKLHLIETAIKSGDLLEIQMPHASGNPKSYVTILAKAQSLVRTDGDAILSISPDGTPQDLQRIFVSHITHLRRLHF